MIEMALYGTWESPITKEMVAKSSKGFGDIVISDQGVVYFVESRPLEGARCTIMNGDLEECLPNEFSAKTRVHEYGGLSFAVDQERLYFVNFNDQHLYVYDQKKGEVKIVANEDNCRYGDLVFKKGAIFCVKEEHVEGKEAKNALVQIDAEGKETVIASGDDFYSSPAISPDGKQIAYLSWNHPNMPWDGTTLWVGKESVAGGKDESIFQPQWSKEGVLYFVSDCSGWWNLYRIKEGKKEALYPMEAEFGFPQWSLGMSSYRILDNGQIACIYHREGQDYFALLGEELKTIDLPFTYIRSINSFGNKVYFRASGPDHPESIVCYDLGKKRYEVICINEELPVDAAYFSMPESFDFSTSHGEKSHAIYYPPKNPDYKGSGLPPVILYCHGGPTAHATTALSLVTQFFTSRGFAFVDLNYAGSSGYGRAYRERLKGKWGIAEIDDCVHVVQFLSEKKLIDPKKVIIRGASAGGYTVLRAITATDVFAIGTSYFGVSDLEGLAKETHKFESRYLDGLIAPYPEGKEIYDERSPINHVKSIQADLLLLQGMEDKIVLPNQAEKMYEAVKKMGREVSYITFDNEQHGFRRAENIIAALEAEIVFYNKVFNQCHGPGSGS